MGILRNLLCVGVFLLTAHYSYSVGGDGESIVVSSSFDGELKPEVQESLNQEVAVIKKIEILDSGSSFFESIVNQPVDGALPVISGFLDRFSVNCILDQYQLMPRNRLIFGCVESLEIDQEKLSVFSDEKKARLNLSKELLKRFFPDEKKSYAFNEIKTVIDQAIEECSLEEILILARSFRHIKRGVEKYPNQLGDYIAEYTLITAIKKHETDNMMNEEKRNWFSDALYELSQTYSHLIDYPKIAFDASNGGPLTMNSTYIDSQKTKRVPIDAFQLNGTWFQFEDLIFHKLSLLKCALIYNNKNLNAVNRLLEYMYHDIEETVLPYVLPTNEFFNSLVNDFRCLDLDVMEYLYTSCLSMLGDKDVVRVPYKTRIVASEFSAEYKKLKLQQIETRKALQKAAESKKCDVSVLEKRSHGVSVVTDRNINIVNSNKRSKYKDE